MITLIKNLGWYHPSIANWSYHIHMIIDESGARLYRETFGGDSRMIEKQEKSGRVVKILFVGQMAKYKWKEVKKMEDIENYDGINYSKI